MLFPNLLSESFLGELFGGAGSNYLRFSSQEYNSHGLDIFMRSHNISDGMPVPFACSDKKVDTAN
jgi:hypothetical protein